MGHGTGGGSAMAAATAFASGIFVGIFCAWERRSCPEVRAVLLPEKSAVESFLRSIAIVRVLRNIDQIV